MMWSVALIFSLVSFSTRLEYDEEVWSFRPGFSRSEEGGSLRQFGESEFLPFTLCTLLSQTKRTMPFPFVFFWSIALPNDFLGTDFGS